MKTRYAITLVFLGLLIISATNHQAPDDWGFFGHRRINRMAVFTLPPEMIGFYKQHIEFITEHAVDPDKRRYATRHEAVRHYIDIDHWGTYPFDEVPRDWTEALMKYTDIYAINSQNDTLHLFGQDKITGIKVNLEEKTSTYKQFFLDNILPIYYEDIWLIDCVALNALLAEPIDCQEVYAVDRFSEYGILPYNLQQIYKRLINAFEQKAYHKILRFSAEIGHYIGDAHVPLHTTENYNGQLTNQVGIHAFWESRIPELYADKQYDFFVGKADFIPNTKEYFWDMVLESHANLDSVLLIEQALREEFPEDQQLCYEERLGRTIQTQCETFAKAYHERMEGMVERRMCASVKAIGNIWFSAWVEAGQPDLNTIKPKKKTIPIFEKVQKELQAKFQAGQPIGRKHEGN